MRVIKITPQRFDEIERAANAGSYTVTDVTLLTPSLNPTELVRDAAYLVVANAHMITIIQLGAQGQPTAVLEQ